ncbi:phosphotransferase enzyme family protein, partial [Streptomyces spiramenti]|uniref:phosphotransferase enzyme family protein n=1 Tax=Streptomyces spiramenti TaxID=2720606 RepID=UPI003083F53B
MSPSHASPAARTLQLLTRRYGVGDPLSCVPLDRGLLNRGYRLATTRGAYFLKHHLGGDPQTVLPLASRHRATVALAARGLPVVPPLADRSGDVAALLEGCCYVLHPWLDGHHREGGDLDVAESERLGDLLGQVHRQLELVIAEDRDATALPGNAHHLAPRTPREPFAADPFAADPLTADPLVGGHLVTAAVPGGTPTGAATAPALGAAGSGARRTEPRAVAPVRA